MGIASIAILLKSSACTSVKAVINPGTQADINEYNMQEEMFHRYQDAYYSGGSAQYNPAGLYNMEFEAALLRDISNLLNSWGGTPAMPGNDYYFWLLSITENGTKWPTQWSHISDQYVLAP